MRARCAASVLLVALGTATAVAVSGAHADDPGQPVTVVETMTVQARVEGLDVHQWRYRAVRNRRVRNRQRSELAALRRVQARRWAPTVRYAVALSRAVYGVDLTRRTYCESRNDPFAVEGHGPVGLLQFFPSTWRTTPFRMFPILDPVAQELAGGWMWAHGRSGEWSCSL